MSPPFGLFEAFGIEIEYMIVDRQSLSIRAIADQVLIDKDGQVSNEVEDGPITWSNELARHVVELKSTSPEPNLEDLPDKFSVSLAHLSERLRDLDARLLPTAMHPWMDPDSEFEKWPYENSEIYSSFDRIFDCRGHGWSNLQSVHLNLPFADGEEFGRLHAAIRMVLPLIPALAASSPIVRGKVTEDRDNRLRFYRSNAKRVPLVTGQVIPEAVFSPEDYEEQVLQPLYRAIAPLDPNGVLQYEWLNARGAIARFDRNTIEIRLIDAQECPKADLAICAAVTAVVRALVEERWSTATEQRSFGASELREILDTAVQHGEAAIIRDRRYLKALGMVDRSEASARGLWQHLLEETGLLDPDSLWSEPLALILGHGTLATRIVRAMRRNPKKSSLKDIYAEIADSLDARTLFVPHRRQSSVT